MLSGIQLKFNVKVKTKKLLVSQWHVVCVYVQLNQISIYLDFMMSMWTRNSTIK